MLPILLFVFLAGSAGPLHAQTRNLEIYWIDVEGGAATLIVSPSGESLLVDTGYETGDRDAKRIFAAAQQAGLKQIDSVVISHFHGDHVGGLAALAKMIPIRRFFDHGDTVDQVDQQRLDGYKAVSAGKRTIVKPGDEIPLRGLQALVVTSDGKLLPKSVNGGGSNPLCANAERKASAGGENQRGVGVLLTYGKFTFLDLIDLDWERDMVLACPANLLGKVTLYQTSRHGGFDAAGAPAFLGAIQPQVVVVNNGPRKGLGAVDERARSLTPGATPYERVAYLRLAKLPRIEGIWQGHRSLLDPDPNHNTSADMTANLGETADCPGHWIKASVGADGKFTVTNGRNGFSKTYTAR
jgi:beta-lactamase superfamily II metal-dependent hydrolase